MPDEALRDNVFNWKTKQTFFLFLRGDLFQFRLTIDLLAYLSLITLMPENQLYLFMCFCARTTTTTSSVY